MLLYQVEHYTIKIEIIVTKLNRIETLCRESMNM